MTNWTLTGAAPLTSFFDEQIATASSIGYLTLDKTSDGGNWVEYSASWPETTNHIRIWTEDLSTGRMGGFGVGIGGSGVEREMFSIPATDYGPRSKHGVVLPITIFKGERVSIRPETVAGNNSLIVNLRGWFDPMFRTDLRYSDLMGKVSISALTVPDPGGTIHTKGAWLQIIASTANDYKGLLFTFGQSTVSTNTTLVNHIFDIGVGATEIAIATDLYVRRAGRSVFEATQNFYVGTHLPAGVKLSARCQADDTTAGVRDIMGVAVIGFY